MEKNSLKYAEKDRQKWTLVFAHALTRKSKGNALIQTITKAVETGIVRKDQAKKKAFDSGKG